MLSGLTAQNISCGFQECSRIWRRNEAVPNSSFTLTRLIMKLFRNHLQPTSQWNCDNIILGFVQWILMTLHEIASADMWNMYRSCFIKSTRMNKNRSCLQIVIHANLHCLPFSQNLSFAWNKGFCVLHFQIWFSKQALPVKDWIKRDNSRL